MQGFDGEAFFARLNEQLAKAAQETMVDVQARLLGYENALIAIIVALDRTGALPIAVAKTALDGMAAGIAEGPLNKPQKEILQRLSKSLDRQNTPRGQPH